MLNELQKARVAKEKQLTSKARAETRSANIDAVRKAVIAWVFVYGILGAFSYNFFDIQFFPSGMTAGDVLFYAFVSLGLGLVGALLAVCGCTLFLPASMYESTCRGALRAPPPSASECSAILPYLVSALLPIYTGISLAYLSLRQHWLGMIVVVLLAFFLSVVIIWVASAQLATNRWTRPLSLGWGRRALPADEKWTYGFMYAIVAPGLCWLFAVLGAEALVALVLPGFAATLALQLLDAPAPQIPLSVGGATVINVDEKRSFRLRFAGALTVVALTAPSLFLKDARAYVFSTLGFLAPDVSLSLNAANLGLVRAAADAAGITLSVCRGPDGSAIVAPIDVRWHGVGHRTLVALPITRRTQAAVELELASEGVRMIRNSKERCVDVAEAAIFQSGLQKFSNGMGPKEARTNLEQLLEPHLTALNGQWSVRELVIVGHADAMPLSDGGNTALGQKRADVVKDLLCTSDKVAPLLTSTSRIRSITAGARESLRECATNTSRDIQRECNEVNRRVEIRMRLVPAHEKGVAAAVTKTQSSVATHTSCRKS